MKRLIYVCVALLVISGVGNDLGAQYLPERRAVRKGNRQFERHNYKNSIDRYVEALDADSTCYEALYNLGNAYYQANLHRDKNPNNSFHWRDADSIFERIGYDTLLGRERRAEALRNLGESRLTQQRFEEALKALKESLKLNPSDAETKYDYMLAKRIVDQQRQQQQNQQDQNQNQDRNGGGGGNGGVQNDRNNDNNDSGDNKNDDDKGGGDKPDDNKPDENKSDDKNDGNGEGDKPDDRSNDDRNGDDDKDDRNGNGGDDSERDRGGESPERQKSGMSREEQQRMLDAVQAEEDKTQDKLKEKGKGVVVRGKKNW